MSASRISSRVLVWAAVATVVYASCGTVTAQSASSGTAGYEVTRTQTVTNAPFGSVGRKTMDRETRVGNTEGTDGNSFGFVMTIGGFVRKCPDAEGIVPGTFEYSLTVDEVKTGDGGTQRTHYAKSITAKLEGHVRNDATIKRRLDLRRPNRRCRQESSARRLRLPVRRKGQHVHAAQSRVGEISA